MISKESKCFTFTFLEEEIEALDGTLADIVLEDIGLGDIALGDIAQDMAPETEHIAPDIQDEEDTPWGLPLRVYMLLVRIQGGLQALIYCVPFDF